MVEMADFSSQGARRLHASHGRARSELPGRRGLRLPIGRSAKHSAPEIRQISSPPEAPVSGVFYANRIGIAFSAKGLCQTDRPIRALPFANYAIGLNYSHNG